MNLVQELWNGYVLQEGQKVQQRLYATSADQSAGLAGQSYAQQPQNSTATNKPGGLSLPHWVLWAGGGLAVLGLALYVAKG